eukprot:11304621-Alexandrium_andersonii.AAC.1
MQEGGESTEAVVEEAPPPPPITEETFADVKPAKPAAPCTKIPLENIADEDVRESVRGWRVVVEQAIELKSWDV